MRRRRRWCRRGSIVIISRPVEIAIDLSIDPVRNLVLLVDTTDLLLASIKMLLPGINLIAMAIPEVVHA